MEENTKTKPGVIYSVAADSGPDFAITRENASGRGTQQMLVILQSKEQYYIKKGEKIELLNTTNLEKFLKDMNDPIPLKECWWLKAIEKRKPFIQYLMENCLRSDVAELCRKGMFAASGSAMEDMEKVLLAEKYPTVYRYIINAIAEENGWSVRDAMASLREKPDNLTNGFACCGNVFDPKQYSLLENAGPVQMIADAFGIETAKYFIESYFISDMKKVPTEFDMKAILDAGNFTGRRFVEYLVFDLCRQGLAGSYTRIWADTIEMQVLIYGKVREKYPENIGSLHRKLSSLCKERQEEIDQVRFIKTVERMKEYEWKPSGYAWQIICPKSKEDMIDEASQQQNCLAGFVSRVAEGDCQIYFLRAQKKELEDTSIVTIEVRDNSIVQVKARNNRTPSDVYTEFIRRWAEAKGLTCRF